MHDHPAWAHRLQVLVPRGDVERDQDVDLVPSRHVALGGDPELIPGGQALDVGREHVLGRDRDAHMEYGPRQDQVRRLAPRAIDGGGLDGEVVDDLVGHFDSWQRIVNFTRTPPLDSCDPTNELGTVLSL